MADTFLDVVNENDEVIGQALRSEIHQKGLWHREAGVYYITPDAKVIFQMRSAMVDVNPNKLSLAAGGHVEAGMSYEEAALAEMVEETGVVATKEQLHLLMYTTSNEQRSHQINRAFRKLYAYIYKGRIEDLKVEDGYGAGFFAYSLDDLIDPSPEIREHAGKYASEKYHDLYRQLQGLVSNI